MAKILLVEDDNNLREIYEARLQAEGYTIVSAHDGEEALVVAKAEKPDLIISDVMMPKISGFEMLDILRNTDSLKNVKVIMLTALGQSDDQQRADKLGTDRYLVKSQVTLEDIVNVTNDLLKRGSQPSTSSTPTAQTTSAQDQTALTPPATAIVTPTPIPVSTPASSPMTAAPLQPAPMPSSPPPASPAPSPANDNQTSTNLAEAATASQEQTDVKSQIENLIANQNQKQSTTDGQQSNADTISPPSAGMKVIEPLADTDQKPNINELLKKEEAKESLGPPPAGVQGTVSDTVIPTPPPTSMNDPSNNPVDPDSIAL